jgi:hypothetical protein
MTTTYELRRRSLRADPAGGGEVWLAAAEDAGVIKLIADQLDGQHRRGRRR